MTRYNDNENRASSTKKFVNDSGLSHIFSLITSFVRNYASPKTHNHDGVYAKSSHTHATSQVTGLDSALAGKAPASHTHTIAQVTNLQSSLDSKTPNSRKVNGKPLSTDITLTSADVKADAAGAATNALNSAKQYTDTVAAGKAAKSHVHDATNITTGTLSQDRLPLVPVTKGGSGKTTGVDSANFYINSLTTGSATPQDADNFVIQSSGGGTTTTTYHRKPISALWSYIKSKADAIYQPRGNYAASSHNHSASNITSGTLSIERGGTGATTVNGVRNMIGVNPITTTGNGSAYVASVPHISTLVAGATFTMVPHVVSAAVSPTLNVNNLGAKPIRQRLSNSTLSTAPGATANWLAAGKPVDVMYDGQFWVVDFVRPNMASAYGVLPVENGGTGASNAADACKHLNAVKYGADKMTEGILQMDDIGYSVKWIAHDGREARMSVNDNYIKYTRKASNGTYLDKFVNWNSFYSEQAEKASVMLVRTLANTLSDAQAAEVLLLFDDWRVNVQYKQDDLCRYNDKLYRCNNEHTSSGRFTPEVASLWTEIEIAPDGVMIWHAPSGSHDAPKYGDKVHYPGAEDPIYTSLMDGNTTIPSSDDRYWAIEQSNEEQDKAILEWKPVQPGVNEAYKKGDKVTHKGKTWISDIDNNVWEPSVYGWTEDGGAKPEPEPEPQPEPSGYPAWKQPTGGHDAYKKGDKVSHKGKNWQSTVDANVWEPSVYGWVEVA